MKHFSCYLAVYQPHCDLQKKEIERIQKEENMSLPQDVDYLSLPVSLSQEVREILDKVRPSTVSLHIQSIVYLLLTNNPLFFFLPENKAEEPIFQPTLG